MKEDKIYALCKTTLNFHLNSSNLQVQSKQVQITKQCSVFKDIQLFKCMYQEHSPSVKTLAYMHSQYMHALTDTHILSHTNKYI